MGIICENCGTKIWSENYNPMWNETTCKKCGAKVSSQFNEYDYVERVVNDFMNEQFLINKKYTREEVKDILIEVFGRQIKND